MLKRLDLNLLPVLEILLEEQSVTAAAARLHLSQSAVSKQLTRLREVFDDPLFERTAYGLKPTPKALSLRLSCANAYSSWRNLLAPTPLNRS